MTTATTNTEIGLPELTGSSKQIAWAESIRAEFLPRLSQHVEHFILVVQSDPYLFASDKDAFIERIRETENATRNQDAAAWWIEENRNGLRASLILAPITQWTERVIAERKEQSTRRSASAEELGMSIAEKSLFDRLYDGDKG